MSATACPECGFPISAHHSTCPECGFPIKHEQPATPPTPPAPHIEPEANKTEEPQHTNNIENNDSNIENNPNLTHCPDCNKLISRQASKCPHCGRYKHDIGQFAYDIIATKFADFSGRATRLEYFTAVAISIVAVIVGNFVGLLAFILLLSAQVRRLHDTNRSGWWALLLLCVPIVPLFMSLKDSDPEENDYGYSPKYQPEMFEE